jgi:hypothetical protein
MHHQRGAARHLDRLVLTARGQRFDGLEVHGQLLARDLDRRGAEEHVQPGLRGP